MRSNGSTSSTSCAPTVSNGGRPAGKWSSITHWVKGSVMIGQASSRPVSCGHGLPVGIGGGRHDAVDHGAGEGDIGRDQSPELGIAQMRRNG